jgi:carbamoyl-phosphate synthase large subunit
MWSVEKTTRVPISLLAGILVGPGFKDAAFEGFLLETVIKLKTDLVIPNMDSATVSLSRMKEKLALAGARAVVSDFHLCATMEDKIAAQQWFAERGLPVPLGNGYPRIAKKRFGFGSRDQFVAFAAHELEVLLARQASEEFIVQPFISGQEYTVDAYVDRAGHLLAALSRKRIEVLAGEVDVSETHHNAKILELTARALAFPGWEGPITLQFIDSAQGPVTIEVNPRFGGGVTHSIHCGLDMPRWLLREHLGLPLEVVPDWPDGSIMTRCRRDVFL